MEIRPFLQKKEHPIYDSDYKVNTNEIISLYNDVSTWIDNHTPGAIIYGRPRIGKTKAIECIRTLIKMNIILHYQYFN